MSAAEGGSWSGRELHFVGIGGAGMSGLARVAIALGAETSGSDASASSTLEELTALGARISVGHAEANVPVGADVVWSSAIPDSNPELAAARRRGQALMHRSDLLAELTRLRRTIAVTGTHGKTTTSAMVLRALRGAGIEAGWVIGAGLQEGEPSAGLGAADWLVVEADESDRSLLALDCEVAVVTNLELDHHATYKSFNELEETVGDFCSAAASVVFADGPGLDGIAEAGGRVAPAAATAEGGRGSFSWRGHRVELAVPGLHNCANAAAALEAAAAATDDELGLVDGIAGFRGTARRFELRGAMACGANVYDDYAHHPTEVEATIAAARTLGPARIVAAFQPHLYSRTEELAKEFAAALATADVALVADVYPARERQEDHPGVSAGTITSQAAGLATVGDLDALRGRIAELATAGDLVLLMGAGDIGTIAEGLIDGG